MAILFSSEHDLPTLRITVGQVAETRSQAIFQAVSMRRQTWEIARCPLRELGLPPAAGELQRNPEEAFRVPENVLESIKSAALRLGPSPLPPKEALWLALPSPRGYLYVLPWERMLEPVGRPLLRRPQHALRPAASATALCVALCASSPAATTTATTTAASSFDPVPVLRQLCRIWQERSGREVTIHVFTDAAAVAPMREWVAGCDRPVAVHDPPPDTQEGNPWLPWIREALAGTALDVLHFAAHGHLDHDRGMIALAGKASDAVHFAGAPELAGFLPQVGAWSLVLTAPAPSHHLTGLRELADAVSQAGPCVTAVHEMGCDDTDFGQLGDAVATIMGRVPPGLDPMPAVTCWVHPQFLSFPRTTQEKRYLDRQGNSSFISDSTHAVLARDDTPAWVASATRTLEALQAKWLPRDPGKAMDPDALAALDSISSLVQKHIWREVR